MTENAEDCKRYSFLKCTVNVMMSLIMTENKLKTMSSTNLGYKRLISTQNITTC